MPWYIVITDSAGGVLKYTPNANYPLIEQGC